MSSLVEDVLGAIEAVAVRCVAGPGKPPAGACASAGASASAGDAACLPARHPLNLSSSLRLRGTSVYPFRMADGSWIRPALLRR